MLEKIYQAPTLGTGHPRYVEDASPGPCREVDPEDELEYEPQPEDWHTEPQERKEGSGIVQQAIFFYRRVDAERDRDDRGDDQGASNQQERREYPIGYDLADRSVLLEAYSQIAVEQVTQPDDILDGHRLVQPVLGRQVLDIRLRYVGVITKLGQRISREANQGEDDGAG